jgi:hypothetical protein
MRIVYIAEVDEILCINCCGQSAEREELALFVYSHTLVVFLCANDVLICVREFGWR